MLPPSELLEYRDENVKIAKSIGLKAATRSKSYHHACRTALSVLFDRLFQALLTWRHFNQDPRKYLVLALSDYFDCWKVAEKLGGEDAKHTDANSELLFLIAFLLDRPAPFTLNLNDMQAPTLVDGVIANWLYGAWDESQWDRGMQGVVQLGEKRTKLFVATHENYRECVFSSIEQLPKLFDRGDSLFKKRVKNSFYGDGPPTEGDNGYNDLVPDYILAAIAKKRGYQGDSVHLWRWSQ